MPPERHDRSQQHGRPTPREDTLGRLAGLSLNANDKGAETATPYLTAQSVPKLSTNTAFLWCLQCHGAESVTVGCNNPSGRSAQDLLSDLLPAWENEMDEYRSIEAPNLMISAPHDLRYLLFHLLRVCTQLRQYANWVEKRDAFLQEFVELTFVDEYVGQKEHFMRYCSDLNEQAQILMRDLSMEIRKTFNRCVGGWANVSAKSIRRPGARQDLLREIFEHRMIPLDENIVQSIRTEVTGFFEIYRQKVDFLVKDWEDFFGQHFANVYQALMKSGYQMDIKVNHDAWLPRMTFPAPPPSGWNVGRTQPQAWVAELSFRPQIN